MMHIVKSHTHAYTWLNLHGAYIESERRNIIRINN